MHERQREVDGRFIYHELRLLSIAARFKSDAPLSGRDDAVTATQEAFGDKCPEPSPGGIVYRFKRILVTTKGFEPSRICRWIRLLGVNRVA